MIKVITRIIDRKAGVSYKNEHSFRSKLKMQEYKECLIDSINDDSVTVSFTTYVKEKKE